MSDRLGGVAVLPVTRRQEVLPTVRDAHPWWSARVFFTAVAGWKSVGRALFVALPDSLTIQGKGKLWIRDVAAHPGLAPIRLAEGKASWTTLLPLHLQPR